jgi:hypothetical protein
MVTWPAPGADGALWRPSWRGVEAPIVHAGTLRDPHGKFARSFHVSRRIELTRCGQ